jgi:molybdate transport system substrate-binding protein
MGVKPFRTAMLVTVLTLGLSGRAFASEVLVAAASDLSAAIKEIATTFEKNTKHSVKLTLGSSGNFHAQIRNGAPFDVFLSADINYVRELEKAGLTVPASISTYAIGRIVLWVPQDSPIRLESLGMKALLDPQARRIAIANPAHAPYGRAAVDAMKRAGVYEASKSRFVLGENISQAAQFVQTGAADIGVIALSLALTDTMKQGRSWDIPANSYPEMQQAIVVLKQASKARHDEAAQAFLKAVLSAEGRAILQRYGFSLPPATRR